MINEPKAYLLDTQVALWILLGSSRLREPEFRARFCKEPAQFIFHQISLLEIQIKFNLGKLELPKKPGPWIFQAILNSGFRYERTDDGAIFGLSKLPMIHRDPFDRLLVAHALVNRWTVISADRTLEEYPIDFEGV